MVSTVLNFTIAANTQSAEAGVQRVGAAFEKTGSAAASMASKFEITENNAARVAKSLGLELSSGAERAVSKLEALRDHLTRTGAPAADLVRVTEALAEADKKYAASLTSTTQKMSVWQEHGTAMAASAGVMATALFGFGVIAVKAFGESQEVAAQLDAVLESTGHAAGITKEEVLGLADALSKVTPFDDEVITQGETLLLQFTAIGKDIFPRATKAMLDLAARMGIDVPSAAKMLGKALDQPADGFTALAKATGKFTDSEVNSIKEMVAFGETGKAQAMMLDLVEKKVGGAAEAIGKTLPGQLKIAETAAGNFNEEVGSKLVPTLQSLITEFPNVATAAVGVFDAWKNLGISGGELLIAVPLIKTAFAGMGATLSGMIASSGPIALAIVGIGALAATIYSAVTALQAFNEKQIATVQANITATRATEGLTRKAQEYGIQLTKGNETQEQFNARLFESIAAHEKLNSKVTDTTSSQQTSTKAVLSHVITLQQQIDKQRALVDSLSHQKNKDQELTDATEKLNSMLQKQGEGAKKASEAHKQLATQIESLTKRELTGFAKEIAEIEAKWKSIVTNKDITPFLAKQATDAANLAVQLSAARIALKHTEDGYKELKKAADEFEKDRLNLLNLHSKAYSDSLSEQIANDKKVTAEINKVWDDSYKARGAARIASAVNEREKIIIQYQLDLEEFERSEAGKMLLLQSRATYDEKIASLQVKRDADLAAESVKSANKVSEVWNRQVSTIVTDLSKGIADSLVHWKGFGESLKKIAQEFGSGILRTLIETWFKPLEGLLQKAASWIQGLFGGGGGNAGAVGGAGLLGSIVGGLPMLGAGLGAGLLGNKLGGGVAGKVGGAAVGGLGAAVAAGAFAPTGAAGAFAGGAFSGIGAGAMGVLSAIPIWGWAAIGASIAAGPLISKLTQRGRDKVTATGGAEDLSENVWQGIIPDVKAGNLTIQEGIDAVNAAWVKYEQFLHANVKDSVVVQRSLDTQRATLTQSIAELEAMRTQMGTEGMADLRGFLDEMARTGTVTDEAIAGLTGVVEKMQQAGLTAETNAAKLGLLGAQFFKTGQMTNEFQQALESAGGSSSFFTRITGEIQKLQGLRQEFASLKQMVDSFLPVQKTWQEQFVETGEITDEMAEKIRQAGGDIQQFKKFADLKNTKTQFQSLIDEFNKTGVASEKLLEMIKEFGGDDATKAFEDLMDQAKESGKTIGELAKDSESSAKIIQAAFDSTSSGINKAFTDAAKQLSDTLAKMDENLGKAIQSLQTAMVTMISDLINVLLGVPGAAEKAARDANFFLGTIHDRDVRINFVASGLSEIENRANRFGAINTPATNTSPTIDPTTVTSGGSRGSRDSTYIPQMAEGGIVRSRPGGTLVNIGEAGRDEAVIPLSKMGSTGSGNTYYVSVEKVVTDDPEAMMAAITRMADTNQSGARVKLLKAMRLREMGAF